MKMDIRETLFIVGPLLVCEEEGHWYFNIIKEVSTCPEGFELKIVELGPFADTLEADAQFVRSRHIEELKRTFPKTLAAETPEDFAEQIAIQFPSEKTRAISAQIKAFHSDDGPVGSA